MKNKLQNQFSFTGIVVVTAVVAFVTAGIATINDVATVDTVVVVAAVVAVAVVVSDIIKSILCLFMI